MKKIKVLHFPIRNNIGGVTQYALNNWKYIDKERFQFDFATLSKNLDYEDELIKQGCKVFHISCYAEDNKTQFAKEINQILDENYDVIHLHTSYWKTFCIEEIAKQRKVPKVIVHSHNTMVNINDENERIRILKIHNLQKRCFTSDLATDFCACSQMAADWLFGEQIPKDKIRIMKNAIDVEKFSYNENVRNEYRKKLGLENCYVLGHVGRFVYQKNHEFLIDVFNEVLKNIPTARLMLIGTGELEIDIREKLNKYGIQDKVLFLGKCNDVNYWMQAMDLFLLPSKFEGLPIVLIEAQSAGLKCLASANISREAAITDNIEFIPLNGDEWIKSIIRYSKGYERKNLNDVITNAGYNIRYQVRELENLYAGI